MSENGNSRLRIGDFDFDCLTAKLLRDGQPIKIQPQPLRVFQLLVERRGQIVSREELHRHIWNGATFVEFDQGLNYCIRQIRRTLGDDALNPRYIETLPKQGYRLIARAAEPANGPIGHSTELKIPEPRDPEPALPESIPGKRRMGGFIAPAICIVLAFLGVALYFSFPPHMVGVQYTQLTYFDDSAVSPMLSPDGRMLVFFRSEQPFLTTGQLWLKMLPDGEARRLTDDTRWKYGPTFSSDGSQIFYTAVEGTRFVTYTVPVLGGAPRLVLDNAAGLSQIGPDQVLFSRVRSGLHMGLVMGTLTSQHFRNVYFPTNERAMVHYSAASSDRKTALAVEMDERGDWGPCRIVSLNGSFPPRQAGPGAPCTSAVWSPDGSWMYFTVATEGAQHVWRQKYPDGVPQQITFGPTSEEGLQMESGGHSLITALGMRENSIWLHDSKGDRPIVTEGEILGFGERYPPSFTEDGRYIYYLARARPGSEPELWRVEVNSGKSEAVFPGLPMLTYDISRDGTEVLYSNSAAKGTAQIGIAALNKSFPPRQIPVPGSFQPYFGPGKKILFLQTENNRNYLEEMNLDGSGRRRALPFQIIDCLSISPARRWLFVAKGNGDKSLEILAVSLKGDPPRTICTSPCYSKWSPNGKWLFVPVTHSSGNDPGRSLAIPIGSDETLPELPAGGIEPNSRPILVKGAQLINRESILPGAGPSQYAYLKGGVHRNLYRISLQ
jgi:DNA-binding winged helix-turn-helix (wHTH) protein/Tol biopolymer transport system component